MRCARLPGSCIAETAHVSQRLLLLYNRDLYSSRLGSASVLHPQTLHTSAERYNNSSRKALLRTAHTSCCPSRFPWYSGAPTSENDDSSELYRSDKYLEIDNLKLRFLPSAHKASAYNCFRSSSRAPLAAQSPHLLCRSCAVLQVKYFLEMRDYRRSCGQTACNMAAFLPHRRSRLL